MDQSILTLVFGKIGYLLATLLLAGLLSVVVIVWPNIDLLTYIVSSQDTDLGLLKMLSALVIGGPESIGWLAVGLIVANSLLLSSVTSMLVFLLRNRQIRAITRDSFAATGSGLLSAFFGIGCIACGPLLLGGLFAAIGASGFLLALPLHGAEFGVIAIILLLYAVYSLAKVITAPSVCDVNSS